MSDSREQTSALPQAGLAAAGAPVPRTHIPCVSFANAGDHALIHRLLLAAQQNPPWERFSAWLEDPYYDPSDRVLLRRGSEIIGHVHLIKRTLYWGGERIAAVGLHDLVALPEYDEPAGTGELLVAAEDRVGEMGAVLALMRTCRPDLYERMGWIPLGREGFSRASAHDILAHVSAQPHAERREAKIRIRMWRHIETEKLAAIQAEAVRNDFGPVVRNDRYWHWLVGRKDHDFILLAESLRSRSAGGEDPPCVGYAVARQDRLIEMVVLPGYPSAAVSLLARACREVVERGFHTMSLFLPAEHPLHEVLLTAGGQWCTVEDKPGRPICKIFGLDRFVERTFPVFRKRAQEAGLELPCHIRFDVDGRPMQFSLTRRGARLARENSGCLDAPGIACSMDLLQRLLLGRLEVPAAAESGRLRCSDALAARRAAGLCAPLAIWQSLWDGPCW